MVSPPTYGQIRGFDHVLAPSRFKQSTNSTLAIAIVREAHRRISRSEGCTWSALRSTSSRSISAGRLALYLQRGTGARDLSYGGRRGSSFQSSLRSGSGRCGYPQWTLAEPRARILAEPPKQHLRHATRNPTDVGRYRGQAAPTCLATANASARSPAPA